MSSRTSNDQRKSGWPIFLFAFERERERNRLCVSFSGSWGVHTHAKLRSFVTPAVCIVPMRFDVSLSLSPCG